MENEDLRKIRMDTIDFSKHVVTETLTDEIKIWEFADPNTNIYGITFINCKGIMSVTGDVGNWIFCREFHPSAEGYVSDSYWCEKLTMTSSQNPYEFDSDATEKHINELLQDEDEDLTEEGKEYLQGCLNHVGYSEFEYDTFAYNNFPDDWDAESVPKCKKIQVWLLIVFDAFDEICRRMDKESKMQVVINTIGMYLSFSDEFIEKCIERGLTCQKYDSLTTNYTAHFYESLNDPEYDGRNRYYLFDNSKEFRTNKILIDTLKEFGAKANSECCECKIVEIPDELGLNWDIGMPEGPGGEWIYEHHRTWN